MNDFGNRAFSSCSARKYFMTCEICFQKFSVSCHRFHSELASSHSIPNCFIYFYCQINRYLIFGMALGDQDVDDGQLVNVAMTFELLPDLCADGRDGHVQLVHSLDLRGLYIHCIR